ncbi:MAG: GntR family transcriptional regulator [Phycisphaerales bacterium]|nr:GntR family transcriptional regulator [Phycisphaerales bacterium]
MLTFRITPGSPAPIYQQIATQIRHAIATEALQPGDLVPSVRALAEQLLINPNTVAKAYADLSRDGLLEALPGKGLVVANHRPNLGMTKPQRLARLDPILSQLLHEAIALNLSAEDLQHLIEKKFNALEKP